MAVLGHIGAVMASHGSTGSMPIKYMVLRCPRSSPTHFERREKPWSWAKVWLDSPVISKRSKHECKVLTLAFHDSSISDSKRSLVFRSCNSVGHKIHDCFRPTLSVMPEIDLIPGIKPDNHLGHQAEILGCGTHTPPISDDPAGYGTGLRPELGVPNPLDPS